MFRAQVGVARQLVPRIMKRKLRHLMDLVSAFKEPARGLVPQVMEMEVINSQNVTCARERRADAVRVKGEDEPLALRLLLHDLPGIGGVLKTPMIALLGRRVFRITHETR